MQTLQFLIDTLSKERNIHISVVDISGSLTFPDASIKFGHVVHSKDFCEIAKSSEKGAKFCLRFKKLCNSKAITEKKAFCGQCIYGIYEAAMPVVADNVVMAIVYVGNAVIDYEKTINRIEKTCSRTGVNSQELLDELPKCEHPASSEELMGIAEIVCDYIKLLCEKNPKQKETTHWLVAALKRYADEVEGRNPTLKELATTYNKTEKYMGKLFDKHMGMSFSRYCLILRLKKAKKLILSTDDKIIDIAFECGFDNISYFNRSFKKEYGISPTAFRNKA